jgi:hypothetical protein
MGGCYQSEQQGYSLVFIYSRKHKGVGPLVNLLNDYAVHVIASHDHRTLHGTASGGRDCKRRQGINWN